MRKRSVGNGRVEQVGWREDPEIVRRAREGWILRTQGLQPAEIGKRQGIDLSTVYRDRERWLEVAKEQIGGDASEHIENLRALWQKTHELLESTGLTSQNKSAYVSQLRAIEMDIAKLDGSLIERKEVKGEITNLLDFVKQVGV